MTKHSQKNADHVISSADHAIGVLFCLFSIKIKLGNRQEKALHCPISGGAAFYGLWRAADETQNQIFQKKVCPGKDQLWRTYRRYSASCNGHARHGSAAPSELHIRLNGFNRIIVSGNNY